MRVNHQWVKLWNIAMTVWCRKRHQSSDVQIGALEVSVAPHGGVDDLPRLQAAASTCASMLC